MAPQRLTICTEYEVEVIDEMRAAGAECARIAQDALSAENKGKNNNNNMRLRANQPSRDATMAMVYLN